MLDSIRLFGIISLALVVSQLGADAIKATAVFLWKRVALWAWSVMMLKGTK
jgi:hypothetical protein